MNLDKDFYSCTEVAKMINKSRQQVNLNIRLGKIKASTSGRVYIISKLEVERLLKDANK